MSEVGIPPLVPAKLMRGRSSMGFVSYWIVDEKYRSLHTEPVCLVPERYHDWFKEHIEQMEFEYWGLMDEIDEEA